MSRIPNCPDCGEPFENVFEATDHLLEDDEPEFDPKLLLTNGYSLMIGSLLRGFYHHAHNVEYVKKLAEDTYATLYAAETNVGDMQSFIEDLIISEHMADIDGEIEELLNDNESGA